MKQILASLFLACTLFSCGQGKKQPKRPAFLFFKLGSTSDEILKELRSLETLGGLKREGDDYYWTSEVDDQTYHYSPIFTFTPGDGVCSEMKLLYFDQMESWSNDLFVTKRNEVAMNLMCYDVTRVKSGRLRNKLVENLIQQQGPYNTRDTIEFSDDLVELTNWKNKDGVDIKVHYRFVRSQLTSTPLAGNSSLVITYSWSR